jgi:SNF2 family DNA or RNA helicase
MELIEPWSLRKEKADCLDLPEKIYQTRYVEMTAHQREIYKTMKKSMIAQIQVKIDEVKGDAHKTLNVKAKMMLEAYLRLQQIAGGFLPELDKDGKTIAVHPIPGANPKINELAEFMDENPHPVVIMCRFRSELAAIAKILEKTRKVVQFHGSMDEDEKKESERAFMAGEADVFLSSLQAGSYGLTLTAASTMIYYSMGFSLEEFLQSQDRIHRIGQTRGCEYISIAAVNSIDQDVVDAITQKKSVADMVNERIKTGRSLDDLL